MWLVTKCDQKPGQNVTWHENMVYCASVKRQYWLLSRWSHLSGLKMVLKHNEWIGRVKLDLGSNRSRVQVKHLKKLNWRLGRILKKYVMTVWSCVNGHFTGKPHRDRVGLDHMLSKSRFTFARQLVAENTCRERKNTNPQTLWTIITHGSAINWLSCQWVFATQERNTRSFCHEYKPGTSCRALSKCK